MKHVFSFVVAAAAVVVFAGCQNVDVAQRELGPDEDQWNNFVKGSYPAWSPNQTLPPGMKTPGDTNFESPDGVVQPACDDAIAPETPAADASAEGVAATDGAKPENAPAEAAKSEVKYTEYVVVKGDSLSIIAHKVYGNGRKYYRIYKANENVISNPDKIFPGTTLRIPAL